MSDAPLRTSPLPPAIRTPANRKFAKCVTRAPHDKRKGTFPFFTQEVERRAAEKGNVPFSERRAAEKGNVPFSQQVDRRVAEKGERPLFLNGQRGCRSVKMRVRGVSNAKWQCWEPRATWRESRGSPCPRHRPARLLGADLQGLPSPEARPLSPGRVAGRSDTRSASPLARPRSWPF